MCKHRCERDNRGVKLVHQKPYPSMCVVSMALIQDPSSLVRLTFSSNPSMKSHPHLSVDSGGAVYGLPEQVCLSLGLMLHRHTCAVRLRDSCKASRCRSDRSNKLVISAYVPIGSSLVAIKETFYQKLHDLLRTAKRGDIGI